MVHNILYRWSAQVLLSLVLVVNSLDALGRTIDIATGYWPPYLDQASDGGGYLARLIREAFAPKIFRSGSCTCPGQEHWP